MGKGDIKTKRGKIFRGTFGKSRPKKDNSIATSKAKSAATAKAPKTAAPKAPKAPKAETAKKETAKKK